jgi:hypothetical protein
MLMSLHDEIHSFRRLNKFGRLRQVQARMGLGQRCLVDLVDYLRRLNTFSCLRKVQARIVLDHSLFSFHPFQVPSRCG